MSIFQVAIFILAVLQAACVGHRTYTDQEKLTLAKTKTIWVDIHRDLRALSPGIVGIVDKVEHNVKDKLTQAGLTVVSDQSTADAVLQLFFDFSDRKYLDEPSSSHNTTYRHGAHSIHIGAGLDHKEVGHVFWHGSWVLPPYDVNLADSTIIRSIDSTVLEALFKSTSPATKKE